MLKYKTIKKWKRKIIDFLRKTKKEEELDTPSIAEYEEKILNISKKLDEILNRLKKIRWFYVKIQNNQFKACRNSIEKKMICSEMFPNLTGTEHDFIIAKANIILRSTWCFF